MVVEYRLIITATFANAADRDAAYAKAKTWATTEKSGGKVVAGTLTKGEYVRPETSSESI